MFFTFMNLLHFLFLFITTIFLLMMRYASHFNSTIHNEYNISLIRKIKDNITTGKQLWSILLDEKNERSNSFLFSNYFVDKNGFFHYHRLYKSITNLSNEGNFPDSSYFRLIPKIKKNNKNILSHTYVVQDYLYHYQHPLNCINKKYLIIRGYGSGHGSEIHVISSYLALAILLNRIAIFDPYIKIMKGHGDFCKQYNNWLCFLEQLTNCSLNKEIYQRAKKYMSKNQTEKYLYIGGTLKYRRIIPPHVVSIVKFSPISKENLIHYWRIQASTFIFRLNNQTNNEVDERIYKSLKHKLNNGCFNIWVRHGDKYKEMQLLNVEDYLPSYELYSKIIGRYIPIYLSTDDPKVIYFFNNYKRTNTYYLSFFRNNGNFFSNMKRSADMTLNFIADIKAALHCDAFSGTRSSNVVRLIDELRSTVGFSANAFYFENGKIELSNSSYETINFW